VGGQRGTFPHGKVARSSLRRLAHDMPARR
jgi:hypothetical protein